MWQDPIVEEIHTIRRKIVKECNYDLKQVIDRLREREAQHKERTVILQPEKRSESGAND